MTRRQLLASAAALAVLAMLPTLPGTAQAQGRVRSVLQPESQ